VLNRHSISSLAGNSFVLDLDESWSQDEGLHSILEAAPNELSQQASIDKSNWSYIPSCLIDCIPDELLGANTNYETITELK
jgi:hypothetical protein